MPATGRQYRPDDPDGSEPFVEPATATIAMSPPVVGLLVAVDTMLFSMPTPPANPVKVELEPAPIAPPSPAIPMEPPSGAVMLSGAWLPSPMATPRLTTSGPTAAIASVFSGRDAPTRTVAPSPKLVIVAPAEPPLSQTPMESVSSVFPAEASAWPDLPEIKIGPARTTLEPEAVIDVLSRKSAPIFCTSTEVTPLSEAMAWWVSVSIEMVAVAPAATSWRGYAVLKPRHSVGYFSQ